LATEQKVIELGEILSGAEEKDRRCEERSKMERGPVMGEVSSLRFPLPLGSLRSSESARTFHAQTPEPVRVAGKTFIANNLAAGAGGESVRGADALGDN
jgi:hypothetical protein